MENDQLETLPFVKDAAMKALSTCLVDVDKKWAKMKIENVLLEKPNAKRISFVTRNGARSVCTGEGFIETIHPIYSGFALHVEKTIMLHCCEEASELVFLLQSYNEAGGNVVRRNKNRSTVRKRNSFSSG